MFSFFKESHRNKPLPAPLSSAFTNNIVPVCVAALWTPVTAWECWKQYDVPYYLDCYSISLGWRLVNLAESCGNFTELEHCRRFSKSQEFGSNYYHTESLCTLYYPAEHVPDQCVIDVLCNNTPTGLFSGPDTFITAGIAAGSLIAAGIFACTAANYHLHKKAQNEDLALLSDAEMVPH